MESAIPHLLPGFKRRSFAAALRALLRKTGIIKKKENDDEYR
jgi:hypothetical protein